MAAARTPSPPSQAKDVIGKGMRTRYIQIEKQKERELPAISRQLNVKALIGAYM